MRSFQRKSFLSLILIIAFDKFRCLFHRLQFPSRDKYYKMLSQICTRAHIYTHTYTHTHAQLLFQSQEETRSLISPSKKAPNVSSCDCSCCLRPRLNLRQPHEVFDNKIEIRQEKSVYFIQRVSESGTIIIVC